MTSRFFSSLKFVIRFFFRLVGLEVSRKKLTNTSYLKDHDSLIYCGTEKVVARGIFQYTMYSEVMKKTDVLKGVIIEAGVGSGAGLGFILKLQNLFGDKRDIFAFDTFEGFPKGHQNDSDIFNEFGRKEYKDYSVEYVLDYLISLGLGHDDISRVKFMKGLIPESFSNYSGELVEILNCDLDLYEPTKKTLSFFWPLMLPGGIILLDEYDLGLDETKWPGAKKAIDEFCMETGVELQRGFGNRPYIVK